MKKHVLILILLVSMTITTYLTIALLQSLENKPQNEVTPQPLSVLSSKFHYATPTPGDDTTHNHISSFSDLSNRGGPEILSWDFEGTGNNWQFHTPAPASIAFERWANASPITGDPEAIGLSSPYDEGTNYFALWDSLKAAPIPYAADKLYRVDWCFSTDRRSANCVPTVRFRIGLTNQKAFSFCRLYPGDWLSLPQRPNATKFQLFFEPPLSAEGLFLAFALFDWRNDFRQTRPAGTIYLEEANVYSYSLSEFTDWEELASISGADFASWTVSSVSGCDPAIPKREADGSLSLSSPIDARGSFGSWDSPPGLFTVEPHRLYRIDARLSSPNQVGGPDLRLRVTTDDYRYNWCTYYVSANTAGESALPPEEGANYHFYFNLPAESEPKTCRCSFDLIDFSPAVSGTVILHKLTIHAHPY